MRLNWKMVALLLALLGTGAHAEEPVTIIKLTVSPQAAPKPALRYALLPELQDMQPGNPIPAYYKCFMDQQSLYSDKKVSEDRDKWLKCPLSELPDGLESYGGASAKQADVAARFETCDWQLLHGLRTDGARLLLPELNQLRQLASVLRVRCRGQIKAGKFDDAIRTLQTMFALLRHLDDHPTLIGGLVGMAITSQAVATLEELVQQPGCPNLFWALTQLPSPFIDLRKALQGEKLFIAAEFKGLTDRQHIWSEEDVVKAATIAKTIVAMNEASAEIEKSSAWVNERLQDPKWLAESRKNLIVLGHPEVLVNKYRSQQVLFVHLLQRYEIARDDMLKWLMIPFWQAENELEGQAKPDPNNVENAIANILLPALSKVRYPQVKLEQRLAMLRIVEGMRLYAAANQGNLPKSLNDIKVPMPVDPVTGKDFTYSFDGDKAILRNTPPKSQLKNAAYNFHYEITVRK